MKEGDIEEATPEEGGEKEDSPKEGGNQGALKVHVFVYTFVCVCTCVCTRTPYFLSAPHISSQKKVVRKAVAKKLPNIDKRLTPFMEGIKTLYVDEHEHWVKNSCEEETWLPHWMEIEGEVYNILEDVPASAVDALAKNKPVPVVSAVTLRQARCQLATASMFSPNVKPLNVL